MSFLFILIFMCLFAISVGILWFRIRTKNHNSLAPSNAHSFPTTDPAFRQYRFAIDQIRNSAVKLLIYIGTSNDNKQTKIFGIASNFSHYIMKFKFSIPHIPKYFRIFLVYTSIKCFIFPTNQQTHSSKSNTIEAKSCLFF